MVHGVCRVEHNSATNHHNLYHAQNNPTEGLLFHPHFIAGKVEAKEWQWLVDHTDTVGERESLGRIQGWEVRGPQLRFCPDPQAHADEQNHIVWVLTRSCAATEAGDDGTAAAAETDSGEVSLGVWVRGAAE